MNRQEMDKKEHELNNGELKPYCPLLLAAAITVDSTELATTGCKEERCAWWCEYADNTGPECAAKGLMWLADIVR